MFSRTPLSLSFTLFALAALFVRSSASVLPRQSQCISYGINYQDGGSYTVDTSSTANFTVVSQFCGCQTDYAIVELVDPSGNAIYCSMVPTTPDDTNETSTCPITDNEITSGQWLILVYGNNGDGTPFEGQRTIQITAQADAPTYDSSRRSDAPITSQWVKDHMWPYQA